MNRPHRDWPKKIACKKKMQIICKKRMISMVRISKDKIVEWIRRRDIGQKKLLSSPISSCLRVNTPHLTKQLNRIRIILCSSEYTSKYNNFLDISCVVMCPHYAYLMTWIIHLFRGKCLKLKWLCASRMIW